MRSKALTIALCLLAFAAMAIRAGKRETPTDRAFGRRRVRGLQERNFVDRREESLD